MLENKRITFIGAGSMAESIIAGLLSNKLIKAEQITATNRRDEKRLTYLSETYKILTTVDKKAALANADVVILAMKPKNVTEGVESIRDYINESQLFISILAGVTTAYIEELLQVEAAVIRTMPNTSAKVGASATALSAGKYARPEEIEISTALFAAIGTVHVIPEEKQDAFTGVAGSGPAYIYYLVEAMEQAAVELGLEESGKELVLQTLKGAVKRLESTSKTPKELYKEVMSPGGATEAAIEVLSSYQFQKAMNAGIKRSVERSTEMGKIYTETK